jgi:nucleotide-binding universal stress UspA family protein
MQALIAIDTSEQAEHVVESAASLLRTVQQPRIRLLTVTDDADVHETTESTGPQGTTTPLGSWSGSGFHVPTPSAPRFMEDRTQALARVHGDLMQRNAALAGRLLDGLEVDCEVVSAARTVDAILESAEEFAAAVIIMGTRGRRGISRALMGSTAQGVIQRSPIPVLIVGDAVGRSAD